MKKKMRYMTPRIVSLLLVIVMMIVSSPASIALDIFQGTTALSEQVFTLTPEQGVTVTLSGQLPVGGYAEAEAYDTDDEDVLHAYDITIYYRSGAEFEPKDEPIDVSFSSDLIADAAEDADTTLEIEHICDSGEISRASSFALSRTIRRSLRRRASLSI